MSVAATIIRLLEPTNERVEPTTIGIIAIEITHSTLSSLFCSFYEFIVSSVCGVILSPHCFAVSQAQHTVA